jgi:hypothetical protein
MLFAAASILYAVGMADSAESHTLMTRHVRVATVKGQAEVFTRWAQLNCVSYGDLSVRLATSPSLSHPVRDPCSRDNAQEISESTVILSRRAARFLLAGGHGAVY